MENTSQTQIEVIKLLRDLTTRIGKNAACVDIKDAYNDIKWIEQPHPASRPTFKLILEISPAIKVPVQGYKRVLASKLPTGKKIR